MHNAALAAAGLRDWRYLALPLPPERFAETVRALPAAGFRGINVTIPHKEAALALAAEATATAAAVGAANTLTFLPAGAIHADNTDVARAARGAARGSGRAARALVLGAGGAAPRRRLRAAQRGRRRRDGLEPHAGAGRAACRGARRARRRRAGSAPRLLVNCTSVGLLGNGPPVQEPAPPGRYVGRRKLRGGHGLQARWHHAPRRGEAAGGGGGDGLEILVAQGAASFERWTGMTAPRDGHARRRRPPRLSHMNPPTQAGAAPEVRQAQAERTGSRRPRGAAAPAACSPT